MNEERHGTGIERLQGLHFDFGRVAGWQGDAKGYVRTERRWNEGTNRGGPDQTSRSHSRSQTKEEGKGGRKMEEGCKANRMHE